MCREHFRAGRAVSERGFSAIAEFCDSGQQERPLSNFNMRLFSGLLNNNPLTRWVKNQRNAIINDQFKKRAADRIVVPSDWIPENRRAVVFSIAFNKAVLECVLC